MKDKGLAKLGDSFVNFCFSLAKSIALSTPTGDKVQDIILARAIRATPIYKHLKQRTDAGTAGDAYEAIMAFLWMTGKITIEEVVEHLSSVMTLDSKMSRKREVEESTKAFQSLLEKVLDRLPETTH